MLRIYGAAKSRAIRVLWMAGELGLKYEHLNWLPRAPETKTPDYLALNANARVPTIDDDGFVLSESMAINFYLAHKHKSSLAPANLQDEARALQWSLWETDRLDRQIVNYQRHATELPEAQRKREVADENWKECCASFDVLEQALAKSDWLVGKSFSVADLNVASALFRALAIDLSKWPRTKAWLHRCWERPAAQKAKAMRDTA